MPTKKSTATKAPEAKPLTVETLLSQEDDVLALARSVPDGPNSDALKYRLSGIAQQIGALGNAIKANEALQR